MIDHLRFRGTKRAIRGQLVQAVPALLRRCHTARAVVVETAWWQDLLTLPVSQTLSHTVVSCVTIVDCNRDLPAILNETIFAADICLLVCSLLSVVAAACAGLSTKKLR